jgi:hypothetical protein
MTLNRGRQPERRPVYEVDVGFSQGAVGTVIRRRGVLVTGLLEKVCESLLPAPKRKSTGRFDFYAMVGLAAELSVVLAGTKSGLS